MNANAKKWIEALRSGKYEQAKDQLKKGDKFCCLGVACDISKLGEWSGNEYMDNEKSLPGMVTDWLGLTSGMGIFYNGCLSELNDEGYSFEKIADIIESEPEGLFEQ
jgi:hypothetical protein